MTDFTASQTSNHSPCRFAINVKVPSLCHSSWLSYYLSVILFHICNIAHIQYSVSEPELARSRLRAGVSLSPCLSCHPAPEPRTSAPSDAVRIGDRHKRQHEGVTQKVCEHWTGPLQYSRDSGPGSTPGAAFIPISDAELPTRTQSRTPAAELIR